MPWGGKRSGSGRKPIGPQTQGIWARIPNKLAAAVEAQAAREGVSKCRLVRLALEAYVKKPDADADAST